MCQMNGLNLINYSQEWEVSSKIKNDSSFEAVEEFTQKHSQIVEHFETISQK